MAKLKLEHQTKFSKRKIKKIIKKLIQNPPDDFTHYHGSHLECNWFKNTVYFRFEIAGTHVNGYVEIQRKFLIIEVNYHDFYCIFADELKESLKNQIKIYFPQV